jgi:hypothetical protein
MANRRAAIDLFPKENRPLYQLKVVIILQRFELAGLIICLNLKKQKQEV